MRYLSNIAAFLMILPLMVNAQMENYSKHSPMFLENVGQIYSSDQTQSDEVLFFMQTPELDFFITENGLSYVFKQFESLKENTSEYENLRQTEDPIVNYHRVDLIFQGGQLKKNNSIVKINDNLGVSVYKGSDTYKDINPLESVLFKDVYPFIDLEFIASAEKLKYNFILNPGANIDDIKLIYKGYKDLYLENGKLVITTSFGQLEEGELYSYKESGETIDISFQLNNNQVSFVTDSEELLKTDEQITIDPPLVWATYYGGSGEDRAVVMERNNNGFLYVLTYTYSAVLPTLDQGGISYYNGVYDADRDIALLKFTEDGVLTWATYIGGTGKDDPKNLFYNGLSLVIVGYTQSNNFPTQNPGLGAYYDNTLSGTEDGFIMSFPFGDYLAWSTYLGGSGVDEFHDCVLGNNRLYVVGHTSSTDIVLQSNGTAFYDNTIAAGDMDAYIVEFDLLYNLSWASYLGGTGFDALPYCDMDSLGRVAVSFHSYASDIPLVNIIPGSYSSAYSLNCDIYLTMFDTNREMIWSTYAGGTADDWLEDVIFTHSNKMLLVGQSKSTNFPVVNNISAGYYQSTKVGIAGIADAVQMMFSDSLVLLYSSYYGGSGHDVAFGINIDSKSNIFIVGDGNSSNLPTLNPNDGSYYDGTSNGSYDGFLAEYDSLFNMKWATYMGGSLNDRISDVRVSPSDNVFAVGWTQSSNHPVVDIGAGGYYDDSFNSSSSSYADAMIMKFIPCPEDFDTLYGADSVCFNEVGTIYASGSGTAYLWSNAEVTDTIHPIITTDTMFTVEVLGPYGCIETDTFMVTVNPLPAYNFYGDTAVCYNDSATISVDAGFFYLWEYGQTDSSITFMPTVSEYIDIVVTSDQGCVYVDSTYLEIFPLPVPSISGDTAICLNDTATMIANGATTFVWSDSSTDTLLQVSPSPAGIYNYFTVATDTNMCSDTAFFSVEVYPLPVFWLGNDTTLCQGDSLLLNANNAGADYLWNTADTTQIIYVNTQNEYYVLVTDSNACNYSDSIDVAVIPYADATISDIAYVCENIAPFDFSAADNGGVWAGTGITNTTNGTFDPATAGVGFYDIYYVISGFCGDADTSQIEVAEVPVFDIFTTDETCAGANDGTVIINVSNGQTPYTYLLDATSATDTNTMIPPGLYLVTVIDNRGCADTDSATIIAEDFPCGEVGYYIPNIFSPNADGENDVLYVRSDFVETMTFLIYDRFGEKVFESRSIDLGWDGKYNGTPVTPGVYFYVFKADLIDGTVIDTGGNITVVR